MTKDGYDKILAEINYLETVKRPEISAQIAEARDKGDLSENAEYDASKEAQGIMEAKLAQLKGLISNARLIDENELLDYWGYNPVCFFAPNTSYASGVEYNREGMELKQLIKALHDNEIDVILDVVFNHTAEGNEMGPSFCFK